MIVMECRSNSKSHTRPEAQTISNHNTDKYHVGTRISPELVSQLNLKQILEDSDDNSEHTAFGTTISNGDYMDQYKKHNRAFSGLVSISASAHADAKPKINAMTQEMSYSHTSNKFESKKLKYGQHVLFDRLKKQYYADIKNDQKRHVLVNLHVNRITEIDTVKESFRCQFWISFSWLPTYYEWLDYKEHELGSNLLDWKPSWIPIIAFPELMNEWKLHFAEKPNCGQFCLTSLYGKDNEIGYDPKHCKFIRCKLECDMTFSTGFLLLNFPVDCQDLPISMNEISGGCVFVAEKRKRSFASVHTMSSVMEEWEFVNMIIEIGQLVTGINESSLAQLKVRLKMQRRYEVYLWNIVFFMALISGLTLCSFAVEEVDLGERLAIIITLLLTSVAYQSSVFSTLPNVPYLTLLDKYIVTSFVFMTMVTVETAMLGTKYLDNDSHNNLVFIVTSIAFIGYHLAFFIFAKNKKKYEISKLYMSSKTMLQLYSQSRDRMEVDWKSEKLCGKTGNWKIYTKYPQKLITGEF